MKKHRTRNPLPHSVFFIRSINFLELNGKDPLRLIQMFIDTLCLFRAIRKRYYGRKRLASLLDGRSIKTDQRIAAADFRALLDKGREPLSAQLYGIDTHMDEHLKSIGLNGHCMQRIRQQLYRAITGSRYRIRTICRLDSKAIAHHFLRKYRILDLRDIEDTASNR